MGRVLMLVGALTALVMWADMPAADPPRPTRVAGLDPAPASARSPRAAFPAVPLATADSPETVSVGYAPWSTDPNKVGVGGVWDFDTDVAGTDSMQYWTSVTWWTPNPLPTPRSRAVMYYDYGNNINLGDHALWKARLAAGRTFRRTGLAGVWHVDAMAGVSAPIAGSRSAWCGLRLPSDCAVRDELTNNCFNTDLLLHQMHGGVPVVSIFPGYADQWDQLLYRDFSYDGAAIPLSFRLRASLSSGVVADAGGSGWFTPDPTDTLNMVINPADSVEVWVGAPREDGVYDPNRRWLSDVVDFSVPGAGQPVLLVALSANGLDGPVPLAGSDTSITRVIPGARDWGGMVRVAFRVKTNRWRSDARWDYSGSINTVDGAALVDDVSVGDNLSDFEDPLAIRPRVLLGPAGEETWVDPAMTWITTGRPAPAYGHVHDVSTLPFDHPAAAPGDTAWACNMAGNVLVHSNHDDPQHRFVDEVYSWSVSPTICLTGPRAAAQGIPETLRGEIEKIIIQYDWYSGFDDLYYSTVWMMAANRFMGSGTSMLIQPDAPQVPAWSPFSAPGVDVEWGSPACMVFANHYLANYGQPWPYIDSLQIAVYDQTRCARYGSSVTHCGDARGHYFDNIRVQFVRSAPFTGVPVEPQLDFVRGAFPNPSPDGTATVRFTLRRAAEVRIAFYDLRGALVHEGRVPAVAGPNEYRWPGTTRSGERAAAGVYFYRLFADGVEFRNNPQRVVVLGTGAR